MYGNLGSLTQKSLKKESSVTTSNRPEHIISALVVVLVPLAIILFSLAYLYVRHHVWEMVRQGAWIGGGVTFRIQRGAIEYLSPGLPDAGNLLSDDQLCSVVLSGASRLLGPRIVSVYLKLPGQESFKVPYRLDETWVGVEIVFSTPLSRLSCLSAEGASTLAIVLKNRWTRRIKTLNIALRWDEPVPKPDRWAFLDERLAIH